MIEKIIELDKQVLIFLNSLGSQQYDTFWKLITSQITWIPLFLFIFYLVYKNLGWKHSLLIVLFIIAVITITDQTTNLFKYGFHRLRPCHDPEIAGMVRRVITSKISFSFISGHASNSVACTLFIYLVLKPYVKSIGFLFLWPLVFSYSRIYLGLHFPLDIICGFAWGALMGLLIFQFYKIVERKYFSYVL